MKILLVVDGDQFGGADIALIHLVSESENEFDFELLGHDCKSLRELARWMPHLQVTIIDEKRKSLKSVIAHRKSFAHIKPDIIHITLGHPGAAVDAQIAAHILGISTVAVEQLVHNVSSHTRQFAKHILSRLLVDHVAVGQETARQIERNFWLPSRSVRTIYNGVEIGKYAPKPLGRSPIVGCVGRLEHQKAFHRVIIALPNLPNVTLVLVGSGSLYQELSDLAEKLGVRDRLHFAGWQDNPASYVASFDIFVMPSINEAFPLSIVEAMLLGIPVVSTNVGSIAEAIRHDETGLIVDGSEPLSLENAIKELLADPAKAGRLAAAAKLHANTYFTSTKTAEQYRCMWRKPRGRILLRSKARR